MVSSNPLRLFNDVRFPPEGTDSLRIFGVRIPPGFESTRKGGPRDDPRVVLLGSL